MRQHNQGAQLRRTAASPAIIVGQETTGRITSFSAFLHNQDPQQTLAWSRDKKLCTLRAVFAEDDGRKGRGPSHPDNLGDERLRILKCL